MVNPNPPTLVILAAGLGSRYGGLKQLDSISSQGETIMDFSIFDAMRAGFGKIVFVIRQSFEQRFRAVYTQKLKNRIPLEFVFQEIENVPTSYRNPNRQKPWGTAHALLMAKEVVQENFAVINADDFYGREAFVEMAAYLSQIPVDAATFGMMAYRLENTLSVHGSVSRGICQVSRDGYLQEIKELTNIKKIGKQFVVESIHRPIKGLGGEAIVSMNFWGFTPKYFEFAEPFFEQFLAENAGQLQAEFFIPSVVDKLIQKQNALVKVLHSNARWFGVTYQADSVLVREKIKQLKLNKIYPDDLWA